MTLENSLPSAEAMASGLSSSPDRFSLMLWKPKYSMMVPVLIGENMRTYFLWVPGTVGTVVEPYATTNS